MDADSGNPVDISPQRGAGNTSLALPALFSAASMLSAFLLFWCQPLMAKALLPLLGGAPAVWNTAMLFFQTVLLGGYIYAHLIARLPRLRLAAVHGAVLLAAAAMLPFGDTAHLAPPAEGSPLFWLLATLAATAGLPFFALSASAPLLQTWFERTGHRDAGDPYFLYAASNIGSLAALLGFPFLLEPALSVPGQGRAWAAGFVALVLLLATCLSTAGRPAARIGVPAADRPPAWRERALWAFLGFVPSSLLLGVTSYVSADLAAVPLLWVVPLALYLLSFIVAFGRFTPPLRALPLPYVAALGTSVSLLVVNKLAVGSGLSISTGLVAVNFAAFFVVALVCHSVVAARRPNPARLTEFYVCLSAGGALGGVFNALLAPVLFNWTYEYEIGLCLACLVRLLLPGNIPARPWQTLAPLAILGAALAAPRLAVGADPDTIKLLAALFTIVLLTVLLLQGRRMPLPFAATVTLALGALSISGDRNALFIDRSFFGVHRVISMDHGAVFGFMHGSTLHGMEWTAAARRDAILGYYAPSGPIGQVIAARPDLHHVGVIGLGAGALACYTRPGQDWTFFEIDPAVVAIARDTRFFHFVEDCKAGLRIVVGDGRLALRQESAARYDLLVIDAFSSDSIPMHLLTQEAFALYAARLAPGGLLAMHISNRFLNLRAQVAASAAAAGFTGRAELYAPTQAEAARHAGNSEWVVLAQAPAALAPFAADARWQKLPPATDVRPWTDQYSNIFSAMR